MRVGHGEALAVELVVLLLPHARDLRGDLFPLGLGRVLVQDVERSDLVAAGASTGSPLEPVAGDVVHHRGALGGPDRVVDPRRDVHDRRAEVDALGLRSDVADRDLGSGQVAVLGQRVVLAEPDVLPVELVGVDGDVELAHQRDVLRLAVVGCRPGHVAVGEDAEFHAEVPLGRSLAPAPTVGVETRTRFTLGTHRSNLKRPF